MKTYFLSVSDSSNPEFGYTQNGGQGAGFYDFFPGQQNDGLAFGHAANPSLSPRNGKHAPLSKPRNRRCRLTETLEMLNKRLLRFQVSTWHQTISICKASTESYS